LLPETEYFQRIRIQNFSFSDVQEKKKKKISGKKSQLTKMSEDEDI